MMLPPPTEEELARRREETARKRRERALARASLPAEEITHSASERRLRVVALGRKNYLFFGHPRAGRNIAGLYSLVGSCIANHVEPTEYLTDVLAKVADAETDADFDELLPDRWTPPALSPSAFADEP